MFGLRYVARTGTQSGQGYFWLSYAEPKITMRRPQSNVKKRGVAIGLSLITECYQPRDKRR